MKIIYILGFCMIISCSSFLNAELSADARKLELFNNAFDQVNRTHEKDSNASEQDDEFDLEEWKREYLNMRTAVALYLPVSLLVNPYIIGKIFKKELLAEHLIKNLPFTKGEAICLPLNAVTYIAGVKYINANYPLKTLIKEVAISATKEIAQSLICTAADQAITYLPKWSQGSVGISLRAISFLAFQKL